MYTIRITDTHDATAIREALAATLRADGRFTADLDLGKTRKGFEIYVSRVRLVKAKEYCGQHPGPCPVDGRPKKRYRYLEYEDWIAFHNLVNGLLDAARVEADVFSKPQETDKRMWMRRGLLARVRYDWHEVMSLPGGRRPVRIWNHGTPDQFEKRVLEVQGEERDQEDFASVG
jgi:hypothetical protein